MVADTVAFLTGEGRRVFVDAEHFFDGYASDPDTALRVLDAAVTAGADVAVLCDTNGGMLPLGVAEVVREVAARTGFRLGIHCQDDTGCAVANSVAAVQAGATHVQCTANGYGERAGNADLFPVVGNLVTKLALPVLPAPALRELTRTAHALAEIANIAPDPHQAYVGTSAFAHKAGLHASAIKIDPELYNHMDPVDVGNGQRVLVTEMAGRASVELKGTELGLDLAGHPDAVSSVVATVKEREARGWSFEAADASLELLMRSALGQDAAPPFALESYRVITEHRADGEGRRGGHRQAPARRGAPHRHGRGQRPGPRPRRRPARRAHPVAARAGRRGAERLQGAHPHPRHRRGDPGAHRVDGQGAGVDDGRCARQRRRGVLAGAGRRPGLRLVAHRLTRRCCSPPRSAPPRRAGRPWRRRVGTCGSPGRGPRSVPTRAGHDAPGDGAAAVAGSPVPAAVPAAVPAGRAGDRRAHRGACSGSGPIAIA
jgi:isopropylmalate/homocitrate/citramalate synthase